MKKIILALCTLLPIVEVQSAVSKKPEPLVVGIVSGMSREDYETTLHPFLKNQIKNCSICEIKNLTPYKEDGSIQLAEVSKSLLAAPQQANFLFLHLNTKATESVKDIVESLNKLTEQGFLVVGSAGLASSNEPSLPLNKTLLGSASGVVIIGDLEARERLPVKAYFGPEMLTAIRTPDEVIGKGLGSAMFAGRLASRFSQKTSGKDWIEYFQKVKSHTRKIWPGLEEFFGR